MKKEYFYCWNEIKLGDPDQPQMAETVEPEEILEALNRNLWDNEVKKAYAIKYRETVDDLLKETGETTVNGAFNKIKLLKERDKELELIDEMLGKLKTMRRSPVYIQVSGRAKRKEK